MKLDLARLEDLTVMEKPLTLILNSHQSKRPCRADKWVDKTIALVEDLARAQATLLTSIGLNTWELVLYLAGRCRVGQIVMIPEADKKVAAQVADEVLNQFKLDEKLTQFTYLSAGDCETLSSRKDFNPLRDRLLIEAAHTVYPVSLSPTGKLAALLREHHHDGKIDPGYAVPYEQAIDKPKYEFSKLPLLPESVSRLEGSIIHWTRSSHSPWPGETYADYYHDLISSRHYPRSAFHSLQRIASLNRIAASSRFIRDGYKVVSFSDSSVAEALKLMRWRRRYVYYNFEPYGVAIEKSQARAVGIKPVFYGDECDFKLLDREDKAYFQLAQSDSADWTPESEWRHVGDLDLNSLPPASVRFVVYRNREVEDLQAVTEAEVLALFP